MGLKPRRPQPPAPAPPPEEAICWGDPDDPAFRRYVVGEHERGMSVEQLARGWGLPPGRVRRWIEEQLARDQEDE